ncbi:MAG: GTPase ObgE [Lachnospiraceae bacterium]|nr:GTPase ObgE [Lachnospiraceae bacterium]
MFADQARIFIKSGKGGDGHVSFRRELYVAAGGPDGGDGGKGGDIIFEVAKGLNTLGDFRHQRKYVAQDGQEGGKRRCHGKNGENLVIRVPEGTVIRDEETGKVIVDMSGENQRVVVLPGGKGGIGNMHYATSTMQVPKYAKPGQPGIERWVTLELKVIADVGLVGFPNVGKSTLISAVSNARPKVANYHFTTLNPVLGVVDFGDGNGFVMADIPGLIEGASDGAGLGHEFLRHVERCKLLLHVVDAAGTEMRDPLEDIEQINKELGHFSRALAEKPQIIVANKCDAIVTEEGEEDPVERIRNAWEPKGIPVFPVSAATGAGTKALISYVMERLMELPREVTVYEPEFELMIDGDASLPYTVEHREAGVFVVEGPRIEKMLGYTNLDTEKGFQFFQKFLKDTGILKKLEQAGIEEGDTVRMYGHSFDYYP